MEATQGPKVAALWLVAGRFVSRRSVWLELFLLAIHNHSFCLDSLLQALLGLEKSTGNAARGSRVMGSGGEVLLQLHPRDVPPRAAPACLLFLASLACFVHARDSAPGKPWFR